MTLRLAFNLVYLTVDLNVPGRKRREYFNSKVEAKVDLRSPRSLLNSKVEAKVDLKSPRGLLNLHPPEISIYEVQGK